LLVEHQFLQLLLLDNADHLSFSTGRDIINIEELG